MKSGEVRFSSANLLNDDWIKAGRLRRLASKGDEKAKEELERMRNTKMIEE